MIRTNTTRLKDALPHLRVVLLSSRGEAEGMESARDADADGLPDEWEFHWFGTLAFSPDCLDAYGNTFLYDYQNGYDPNVLEFSIEATNNYVRTASPTLQLDIIAGIPFYQAVLVDNTNLAAASWTAYSSSNLTLNLGTTEGWHEIWIGLKGLPDEAGKTWVWKRLKLDRTAPLLVITNPVVTTVQQPMIELQGYSPEEIASISYDLTNAAGLFTSQPVLVLDRHYDTNTWEFTTNTFQAFDIPLTNGLNTFTLHATDLAGNTTNLILNYTLDYTGKPAPALQLYWPQDGTRICGSRFTWRGRVDDFTAQLTAQIVDANGNTNLVPVLVERDGNWWAENLPLVGGTNELTLTATDAAGNVVTTNISIIQSPLQLIMNDVSGDQLWNPTVNVTGAISDPADYTVWVNGVKARMDGSGAWEADQVPTTPGGTAVFEVRAIPNTDNGGNGTGGSGGNSASYAEPGNPHSADARDTQSQTDKPMRLYVESYHEDNLTENINDSYGKSYDKNGALTGYFEEHDYYDESCAWHDQAGGTGSRFEKYDQQVTPGIWPWPSFHNINGWDLQSYGWASTAWPDVIQDFAQDQYYQYDADANQTDSGTTPYAPAPPILQEHCNLSTGLSGSYNWSATGGDHGEEAESLTFVRSANTVMKLFTGGKAVSQRQNVFQLSASAQSGNVVLYPYWTGTYPFNWGTWIPIDPTQIAIGEVGKLGSDGILWVELPDGVTKDVTPKIDGVDYYTWTELDPAKYHPYILLTTSTTNANLEISTPEVCVGQQATFQVVWLGGDPGALNTICHWHLPDKFVNEQYQYSDTCTSYRRNNGLLTNYPSTSCWYQNKPGGTVSVGMNLLFANGQATSIAATGRFTVYRPKIRSLSQSPPAQLCWSAGAGADGDEVYVGVGGTYGVRGNDMEWDLYVDVDLIDYPGALSYIQLIQDSYGYNYNYFPVASSTDGYWLDTGDQFPSGTIKYPGLTGADLHYGDGPGISVRASSYVYETDNLLTYARFQPSGGIPVTIGLIDWGWNGEVDKSDGVWSLKLGSTISEPHLDSNNDSFPVWINVYHGHGDL